MRRLRIGFSFWGILAHEHDQHVVETPDGLRGERATFAEHALRKGHELIQLQRRQEDAAFCIEDDFERRNFVDRRALGFPEIDVLFVEWRWKRLGKSTEDVDRQTALLDHYAQIGTPIVVQDTDLKITRDDEERWPSMVIGDPCLRPVTLTRERVFMPFCHTFGDRTRPAEGSARYLYVGNNYERAAQFQKYYSSPAASLRDVGVQTTVHGNWLTPSPEREDPRQIVRSHQHVAFAPRVSYKDVRSTLSAGLAVCHISKDEYSTRGNVTVRYFEALSAGVPALIPTESAPMRDVGDAAGLMVASPADVIRKVTNLAGMSVDDRALLVGSQERALSSLADFTPAKKLGVIEAVASGDLRAG